MLVSPHVADISTAALDETPTLVRVGDQRTPRTTQPDLAAAPPKRRRSIVFPFIVSAFVLLLLFAGVGIGIWVFQHNFRETANKNSANNSISNSKSPGNVNGYFPSPIANRNVPSKTPPPAPTPSSTVFDPETERDEVSRSVYSWNSAAEARDLGAYMSNYSDTVDYYRKGGVSRSAVRSDKSRAFGMYRSMVITISDMRVSLDGSGSLATAEFDKEWDFRGSRNSSGKVRSQLRLRNENGRWLIIGERDLKVY